MVVEVLHRTRQDLSYFVEVRASDEPFLKLLIPESQPKICTKDQLQVTIYLSTLRNKCSLRMTELD